MPVRTEAAHEFLIDVVAIPELRLMILEAAHLRELARHIRPSDAGPAGEVLDALLGGLRQPSGDEADYAPIADQIITEMAFCRMVDSFQTYLCDILIQIASRDSVVLGTADPAAVAGEVDKLSRRGGGRRLADILGGITGSVSPSNDVWGRVEYHIEVRNLLVHHRGRVHRRFAEKWGLDPDRTGAVYRLTDSAVRQASADLLDVATRIDTVAVEIYGVPPARQEVNED